VRVDPEAIRNRAKITAIPRQHLVRDISSAAAIVLGDRDRTAEIVARFTRRCRSTLTAQTQSP
jgi:hypothetical protein